MHVQRMLGKDVDGRKGVVSLRRSYSFKTSVATWTSEAPPLGIGVASSTSRAREEVLVGVQLALVVRQLPAGRGQRAKAPTKAACLVRSPTAIAPTTATTVRCTTTNVVHVLLKLPADPAVEQQRYTRR